MVGSSPMARMAPADAYLTRLAGDRIEVRSAGSGPANQVNPAVVQAMAGDGIDISAEIPKVLTTDAVRSIRDDIRICIKQLVAEFTALPDASGAAAGSQS
ncbi:hypothetical protein E1293_14575 [Actinomadura darangshiensis]|uniref:Phosphotyrosine protein phosphatase I domain-containing protein n=1 Tax=Actinomadura darangshiensis TaxID=705336 RepID=A0A4R5BBQ1_9ACTN|nr:hypothetical protein [Actinomadura darangshiensis]TDD83501.1 hypothetical protein E1293_14575 [Actinomadura darangshiensis]